MLEKKTNEVKRCVFTFSTFIPGAPSKTKEKQDEYAVSATDTPIEDAHIQSCRAAAEAFAEKMYIIIAQTVTSS